MLKGIAIGFQVHHFNTVIKVIENAFVLNVKDHLHGHHINDLLLSFFEGLKDNQQIKIGSVPCTTVLES